MATRPIRIIATLSIAAIVASCGGGSSPTAPPASPSAATSIAPVASVAPSREPTPSPSPEASATAAAEASAPAASKHPRPSIDPAEIAGYLTARLSLFNVADDDVSVSLTYIDPQSGPFEFGTYPLGPLDQLSHEVPPGLYRVAFKVAAGPDKPPTCTIDLKDGSTVTFFVASPDAIAVTRTGTKPAKSADVFVATSSLCKAKA